MYRPEPFREDRVDVLTAVMRDLQFAALVTSAPGGIEVSHVPMVAKVRDGRVALESHVARGNPHWKAADGEGATVAIFQGPQAYVSPSWYASKAEHGKVVPTWCYIAVHAHGRLSAVSDPEWLAGHLDDLTDANEASRADRWRVSDAPGPFLEGMRRGIVGLRLEVERLEGAWKINQHKSEADRSGTSAGLGRSGPMGEALAAALARWPG